MPEQVKQVGTFTVAIGHGKPKEGSKNALSPIYRLVAIAKITVTRLDSVYKSWCLQH